VTHLKYQAFLLAPLPPRFADKNEKGTRIFLELHTSALPGNEVYAHFVLLYGD